jgi:DNA primase
MITKPTIDRIMEATDIVEVIGEFVQLKKRGANYVGLSPFANERTPSFTVSPVKGIFKDFSSGKGGSAITFLMELEKFTYPEALKWLAKKYGIEVEETVEAPENREAEDHRESLMIVTGYAAKFFHESLLDTDEGKTSASVILRSAVSARIPLPNLNWVIRPTNGKLSPGKH